MPYAQWILLNIINTLRTQNILVDNVNLAYGKFYMYTGHGTVDNRNNEFSTSDILGMEIPARESREIGSCGRQNSPSGTEGSIDLYYDKTKICTVIWDCPWGGQNSVGVQNSNNAAGYLCTLPMRSWGPTGPIGEVKVEVYQGLAIGIDV